MLNFNHAFPIDLIILDEFEPMNAAISLNVALVNSYVVEDGIFFFTDASDDPLVQTGRVRFG